MDEQRYLRLADETYRKILDLFEDVDGEDADVEPKGDTLVIRFRDRSRCVINTQRPVRQLWLAGAKRAWHFDWDEAGQRWVDDKGTGDELLAVLRTIVRETIGTELGAP